MTTFTSNVPQPTFGPDGFIIPTQEAILAGVTADWQAAFGGALNPSLSTPQGQLITSETAIIGEADETFLFFTNQVDPAYATGRMQDAIARIYFIERDPALPTVVQGLCTGLAGVVIPVGALGQATDGNLYTCTQAGVIGMDGTVTLAFACNAVGPIPCPAGSLSQIYQAIPGWDTITNDDDGVEGQDTETRTAFEARRAASVANNAVGSLPAVRGAVLLVPGVLDAYVTENDTSGNVTIGDFTLQPKSLYVAVVGGDSLAVATAIWSKKAPGCAYNGNTTVTVYDTGPGSVPPYPAYDVTYETPDALRFIFLVALADNPGVPANAAALVQAAIVAAFAGADGLARASIASTVFATRFIFPVAALGPWVEITSLQIGSINAPIAVFTASVSGADMTVTAVASGALAAGQSVLDAAGHVLPGTTIVSQSSGSAGGTGVYVVTVSQTVSSEAMASALPDENTVAVGIDQSPTIDAADVAVTVG